MTAEGLVIVGQTVKKKFLMALGAGLLALGTLLAIFGFTGSAFAVPLGGLGDFFVEFDELNGTGFKMFPKMGETGDSESSPMVRNQMSDAKIKNLHIYKDLPIPGTNEKMWIRFHIKSESADITGLTQDARFIEANLAFENMEMKQKNSKDFSTNWSQTSSTVKITNASIVTDYLFQSAVSLNGAKISGELINGPKIINE